MAKKLKPIQQKHALPQIKHERIPGTTKTKKFTETDPKTGKKYKFKEERFVEKEIEAKTLIKIAPMFFICPDNNKVYMVPLTVQMSVMEALEMGAGVAKGVNDYLTAHDEKAGTRKSADTKPVEPEKAPESEQN